MKNKLLKTVSTFILASLVSTAPQAMELSGKGAMVGVNLASLSGADSDLAGADKSSRIGMALGGFVKMDLGHKLSLRPELLFSQKGVNYSASGTDMNIRLSYLDIPVMLEYAALKGSMPVNVFAGMNIGILLSAENEVSGLGTSDMKDSTNSLDYGLQFGAGTIINKHITVDARYAMGLAKTDKDGVVDMKNSGILFTGGYMF